MLHCSICHWLLGICKVQGLVMQNPCLARIFFFCYFWLISKRVFLLLLLGPSSSARSFVCVFLLLLFEFGLSGRSVSYLTAWTLFFYLIFWHYYLPPCHLNCSCLKDLTNRSKKILIILYMWFYLLMVFDNVLSY